LQRPKEAHRSTRLRSEIFFNAYHGTTLSSITLVNCTQEAMWLASVGDLTVLEYEHVEFPDFDFMTSPTFWILPALACTNADGTWNGERLLDLHTPTISSKYFRVSMSHPAAEGEFIYLFGTINCSAHWFMSP
jgi:hypothetical protein